MQLHIGEYYGNSFSNELTLLEEFYKFMHIGFPLRLRANIKQWNLLYVMSSGGARGFGGGRKGVAHVVKMISWVSLAPNYFWYYP